MPAPAADVLIPYRPAGPEREAALTHVVEAWHDEHLAWPVWLCPAPAGPWSKGRALTDPPGVAEVVIVSDGDVLVDPDSIRRAVNLVHDGHVGWAIPHHEVHRLTREATADVLYGLPADPAAVEERPYRGLVGGGMVVLARELLERVPLDPRFEGWGGEDIAWGMALHCIAGKPWRATAPLIHLWHPPQPRRSRKRGSVENERLRRRYFAARNTPAVMRELLEEAHAALHAAEPPVHAPAA